MGEVLTDLARRAIIAAGTEMREDVVIIAKMTSCELTPMPTVMGVLMILSQSGDTGVTAGDIARRFTQPEEKLKRNLRVNTILTDFSKRGLACRSSTPEPVRTYRAVRTYRWFITDAGKKYLNSGGYQGALAVKARQREQRAARRARTEAVRSEMLADGRALVARIQPGCATCRTGVILLMRQRYLTNNEIGEFFGISRERVRQIIKHSAGYIPECDHG